MRKANWYWFLIFIVMMTIVGFLLFDNIATKLIFGIAVGAIFGWVFTAKKSSKKEYQ